MLLLDQPKLRRVVSENDDPDRRGKLVLSTVPTTVRLPTTQLSWEETEPLLKEIWVRKQVSKGHASPPETVDSEAACTSQCGHAAWQMGGRPGLHSGDGPIQINAMPKRCAENLRSKNIWNLSWNWSSNNFYTKIKK